MSASSALIGRLTEELPRRFPHWGSIRQTHAIPGGFSGAALFRVDADAGSFAVKLSPFAENLAGETAARHAIIEAIAADGEPRLFPRLARDASGNSVWRLATDAGTFVGEARDWLEDSRIPAMPSLLAPGQIVDSMITSTQITSAFKLLARFHKAARRIARPEVQSPYLRAQTPLPERYAHEWRQAMRTNLAAISAETSRLPLDLRERTREYLARLPARGAQTATLLDELPGNSPPVCLCLRDTHQNNIAYQAGIAAAFFDWDALRHDRRVGDYARLAASFGLNVVEAENQIVSAIQETAPADELTGWESASLAPLLATQIWLPPLNWLKWLLVDNRTFDDPAAAVARLRETLNRCSGRPFAADET